MSDKTYGYYPAVNERAKVSGCYDPLRRNIYWSNCINTSSTIAQNGIDRRVKSLLSKDNAQVEDYEIEQFLLLFGIIFYPLATTCLLKDLNCAKVVNELVHVAGS